MADKIILGGGNGGNTEDQTPGTKRKLILKKTGAHTPTGQNPTTGKKLLLKKTGAHEPVDSGNGNGTGRKLVLKKTGAHEPVGIEEAENRPVLKLKTKASEGGKPKLTLKSTGNHAPQPMQGEPTASATDRILLVDDEVSILKVLSHILGKMGFNSDTCSSGEEAIEKLKEHTYDLMITDLNLGEGMSGLDLLQEARQVNSLMPVIMITAFATVKVAVKALKEGAFDLITKPFKMEQLTETVHNAINYGGMYNIESMVKQEMKLHFGTIVGEDPKMIKIYDAIRRLSKIDISVHIQGENGTGKLTTARVLHHCSKRASGPFLAYDCTGKTQEQLEQDLFGIDGAQKSIFEQAAGGSVYIEELNTLEERLQVKLMDIFQSKQITPMGTTTPVDVDVRLIASTTVPLKVLVESGEVIKDLYYRLSAFSIEIPALRHRVEDIPLLVNFFCYQESMNAGDVEYSLGNSAMNKLLNYSWPDNVRELKNAISRAVAQTSGNVIKLASLPENILEHSAGADGMQNNAMVGKSLRKFLQQEIQSRNTNNLKVRELDDIAGGE